MIKLTLFLTLLSMTTYAASNTVMITITANGNVGTKMILKKEGKKFYCSTKDTPEHEIKVRGLVTLDSPFKNAHKNPPDCQTTLSWGKEKKCYHFGDDVFIDDVIRWCTN
jgi:hypothetical protein